MKFKFLKKLTAASIVLVFMVLLTACPYSSSVPIDEGTVKIPSGLEGKWMAPGDEGNENPTFYTISKDDKFHATAKKMEYSSSDSTYNETVYHLTFSEVGDEIFMNALTDGETNYNLYKFVFDDKKGEISAMEVTDYIKETFSNSKELKEFILKNKSNSYFFTNTTDTYVRK